MAMKKVNKKKAANGYTMSSPELLALNPDAQSSITQSMGYNQNLAQQTAGTDQINPVDQANRDAILIDPMQANTPVTSDTIGPTEITPTKKQKKQFRNPFEGSGIPVGEVISGGVNFLNALIPPSSSADSRQYTPNVYNGNAFGTDSTAIYEDGGAITDEDRDAWERMQSDAYKQGFLGNDHNRQPGSEFMKAHGIDPTRLKDYQTDFQNLSKTDPNRIRFKDELSSVDDFYGHRTAQQRYVKYQYENQRINPQTKQYETYYKSDAATTPMSEQQWNKNAGIDMANQVVPVQPSITSVNKQSFAPVADKNPLLHVSNEGFMTKEEAIAAKKARGGNKKSFYMKDGGQLGNHGMELEEKGSVKPISANSYSNPIMQFTGPSHDEGGIGMQFGGNKVEVEGDETAYKDMQGNLQIFGNMKVPGTNKKFKSLSKDIAKKEVSATKLGAKATDLVDDANPFNPYSALKFNTGRVLHDAANQKQKKLTEEKETLATIQNLMLEVSDKFNTTPDKISDIMKNGGEIPQFKDGGKLDRDQVNAWVAASAQKYGVDPNTIQSLINTESGYNSKATSNKGAMSIMQFMPATAKEYGLSPADLKSSDPAIQQKVVDAGIRHFSGLLKSNNNDYKLALAAYNGGQGSIDFVKKELGKKKITGDDWMNFMSNRRQSKPSEDSAAWQNQTYDYVDRIAGSKKSPAEQDWFRDFYYNGNTHAKTTMDPLQVIDRPTPVDADPEFKQFELPVAPINPQDKATPAIEKKGKTPRSLADRNRLGLTDFMSELAYLADRPDDVLFRRVEPVLHTPYQVSFQDRLNENQASFRSLERQLPNNAEALSVLAGQKYGADNAVLADQFRTNQGIANDVTNKNVGILNQNAQMNFQIGDQHDVRQAQAQSNTDAHKYQALASISDKFNRNDAENMNIRLAESMSQYRLNNNNQMEYTGAPAQFNVGTNSPFQNNPNNKVVTKKDANGNVVSVTETDQPDVKEWQDFERFKKMRNAANVTTSRKWGGLI